MVKETILLCDVCKERIAKSTCHLCGKDVCKYRSCIREFAIVMGGKVEYGLRTSGGKTVGILYCRDCWDKKIKHLISKKDFWDEDFLEKTAKLIGDCIRKKLIIENLEDKK